MALHSITFSTLCVLLAAPANTNSLLLPTGPIAPIVIPNPPRTYWSWDTIPTSYHGAVKTRTFTDQEVQRLAKFNMVTIEKWYTPCASKGPTQSGPSCDVESKIENVFRRIRAINPKQTTVMYWNSMFDFSFYGYHQRMLDLEAQGVHAFLRDEHGTIISLCNDGDVYCNMTQYDWTEPKVREFWVEAVINATATGLVDGIFADHSANEGSGIGTMADGQLPNQLCNGKGGGRTCFNFTDTFKESFNSWHSWATNYTQDLLSNTTGGPVIQGPLASMNPLPRGKVIGEAPNVDYCNFDAVRTAHAVTGLTVIEARGICIPKERCLAAYLAAAEPGVYLHCVYNGDDLLTDTTYPEMDKPLGTPNGSAVETSPGIWTRHFASGTVVNWNNNTQTGEIHWADQVSL